MGRFLRADLRYASHWLALAAFTLSAVLIAALVPFDSEPPWPGRFDKSLHALSFMLLMVVVCGPFVKSARGYILALLLVCGVLIELIQIPLPGRREEWGDLLADCVGLAAGFLLLKTRAGDWCLRLEQRLGLR